MTSARSHDLALVWRGNEKGRGDRERDRGRERERDGEACVALVTGTLHRNDFNRSSDTHTHIHTHGHTDACTHILTYKGAGKRRAECADRLM